jgi:hypothetical protein
VESVNNWNVSSLRWREHISVVRVRTKYWLTALYDWQWINAIRSESHSLGDDSAHPSLSNLE